MTALPPLPTWDQFVQAGGYNSCGAHAVASCLVGGGLLPAATALATVEAVVGLGETSALQLIDTLERFGAKVPRVVSSAAITLSLDRYCIDLVQSDGAGRPVPVGSTHITHWVAQYAVDPTRIANSGSGQDETYGDAAFAACLAGTIIDSGCFPPASEDDEMTPRLAELLVMDWYVGVLRRVPAQSEVTYWALQLTAPNANYEQVYSAFLATDEVRAALAAKG